MDASRLGTGEMIAAAGGVALLIVMFLPWFGVDVDGFSASESANAWEALVFIDILLFLLALVAIGLVAARAAGMLPEDVPWPVLLVATGALALPLVLFRLLDVPAPDVPAAAEDSVDFGGEIGLFLALIAAAAIAHGGLAGSGSPRRRDRAALISRQPPRRPRAGPVRAARYAARASSAARPWRSALLMPRMRSARKRSSSTSSPLGRNGSAIAAPESSSTAAQSSSPISARSRSPVGGEELSNAARRATADPS